MEGNPYKIGSFVFLLREDEEGYRIDRFQVLETAVNPGSSKDETSYIHTIRGEKAMGQGFKVLDSELIPNIDEAIQKITEASSEKIEAIKQNKDFQIKQAMDKWGGRYYKDVNKKSWI